MKRIAVYCGSNKGVRPEYAAAAEQLGTLLAREKIELVYGGGMVGLMGIVADAALKHGGHVIGVIPEKLVIKEVIHEGLPDRRIVKNMHERKALMAELADGFIALPGGYGRAHLDTVLNSLSPPKRGEGWGEGIFTGKITASSPRPSPPSGEEREKARTVLRCTRYGTFEEFFEVLAWSQLGWHQKPFGLLDIAGFYRPLLDFLDHTRDEGFIRPQHHGLVLVEENPGKILQRLKNFRPPAEVKWVR